MKRIKFILLIILTYHAMANKNISEVNYEFPIKFQTDGTATFFYHIQNNIELPANNIQSLKTNIDKAFSLLTKKTCITFQSVSNNSSLKKTIFRLNHWCSASLEMQRGELLFAINVNHSCISKEILQRLIYLNINMIMKTKKCLLENPHLISGLIFEENIYDFISLCVFFDPHEAELMITNYNLIEFIFLIRTKRKSIKSKDLKQKDYSKIFSFRDLKYINEKICKNTCKTEPPLECKNGGYVNPKNCTECLCPSFYTGKLCGNYTKPKRQDYCGRQSLKVSSVPATKILNLGVECFYRIEPSINKKIVLTFKPITQLYWDCNYDKLLEIQYLKDKTVDGVMPCGNITSFNITGTINSSLFIYHDSMASMKPMVYIKYTEVGEED
uniref:Metalloendopeptidase n=1 Tax=Strongyloides venezuelensis TaxID=75913 RepID=A0A0K0FQU0_STRVS